MLERVRHREGGVCRRTPGFALYAAGIALWMTLVSCTGSTYVLPLAPEHMDLGVYVVVQQITYIAFYFLIAAVTWRRSLSLRSSLFTGFVAGGFALAAACIVLIYLGAGGAVVQGVYGFGMGLAIAAGYMQWLRLVVDRPLAEIEELLVIASIASIISGLLVAFLPAEMRAALFMFALVPASVAMLAANTKTRREKEGKERERAPMRSMVRALGVPTLCATVLVLVAPVASTTYYSGGDDPLFRVLLAQGANAVGLGILIFLLFGMKRNVSIFNAYCALLPLLASSVLVVSFVEPNQRWFVLFLGDACFCVVSFLMLLTSSTVAKRLGVPVTTAYGLLGGCVYLARLPEVFVVAPWGHSLSALAPFAVAALLLYALSFPLFFFPLLKKGVRLDTDDTPTSVVVTDISSACKSLAERYHLPERQAEVLVLLANGHGASHIAETLCLSENTVKTYRKAIYAALGVHSRQELLNLVHREVARKSL